MWAAPEWDLIPDINPCNLGGLSRLSFAIGTGGSPSPARHRILQWSDQHEVRKPQVASIAAEPAPAVLLRPCSYSIGVRVVWVFEEPLPLLLRILKPAPRAPHLQERLLSQILGGSAAPGNSSAVPDERLPLDGQAVFYDFSVHSNVSLILPVAPT